jgi:TonB family protein
MLLHSIVGSVAALASGTSMSQEQSSSEGRGAEIVKACGNLTTAFFSMPPERTSAVCDCAAHRLEGNERVRTALLTFSDKNGSMAAVDRNYVITKIVSNAAECVGAELDALAENETELTKPNTLSWLSTLDTSVPATWPVSAPPLAVPAMADPKHGCGNPPYPPPALRANATGTVIVRLLVEADGHVSKVRIWRSSGETAAHKLLDATAAAYIADCQFKPKTFAGTPLAAWTDVQYVWKIK